MEKSSFFKFKQPEELTEGDWLAENIVIDNKKVMNKKTLEIEDLEKLKHWQKNKKLTSVLIKDGIPFVPSFLFAYLMLLFGKDLIAWILSVFL